MNKKQTVFLLAILLFLCSSCFRDSNFEFEVAETQTIVTTSKRANSHFFVFFTEKGTAVSTKPSDTVDYIEFKTQKMELDIAFDPSTPRDIYILNDSRIMQTNEVKYKFKRPYDIRQDERADKMFYGEENETIGKQYIGINIDMMRYEIERVNDKKILKKGGVLGGW